MKKKYIVGIIIAIVLVIVLGIVIYKVIEENGKNYEIVKVNTYNYFVLKENKLSGVIDRQGNIIIPEEYDEIKIPNPEKALFVCYKADDIKILNANKEEILTQYEKVEPIRLKNVESDLMYEKSVLKYLENGKYGLIDFDGKKITKPIYEEIDSVPYKEGEILVKLDGKYGIINIKGNNIVNNMYDSISVDGYYVDSDGYKYAGYITSITTEEGYRYGYVNYKGKEILKNENNEISRITDIEDNNNTYLLCAKNGQYGILENEKVIINNEYQSIRYDRTNDLFIIEKGTKYGIAKRDGNVIVPTQYNQIDVTGIYLYAKNEQGVTVYNSNGTQVNIDTNVAILNTENEKYRIRINSTEGTKYGVIGKDGEEIIEDKYSYIEYLFDNYFIASNENSKLGIIDDKENERVTLENDSVQEIEGTDIIQVVNGTTTKLYNKQLDNICTIESANIALKDTYIEIYNENETKYFGKDGKALTNKDIYPNNTLYSIENNGKWGFEDKNGNILVDFKYDMVTEFNEYGFAGIKLEGKWGVINEKGEEIVVPTYELKDTPFFIGQYYRVKYGLGENYFTK